MSRHLTTARDEWPALRWVESPCAGRRFVLSGQDRYITVSVVRRADGWSAFAMTDSGTPLVWHRTLRGALRALRRELP